MCFTEAFLVQFEYISRVFVYLLVFHCYFYGLSCLPTDSIAHIFTARFTSVRCTMGLLTLSKTIA